MLPLSVSSFPLQRRADAPGGEFFFADAVEFALGFLAAGHGKNLFKNLPANFKSLQGESAELKQQMTEVRRLVASRSSTVARVHKQGAVSEDCARNLAAHFVAHCERSGKLEALASLPAQRDALTAFARDSLGLTTRSALTTSDIPLPVEYGGEIRELVSQFGVVRGRMSPYPIGMGTARPARMGTRPLWSRSAQPRRKRLPGKSAL